MNQERKSKKSDIYYKTLDILKNYNKIQKSIELLTKKLKGLEEEKSQLPESIIKSNRVTLIEEERSYYYTDETLKNDINGTKQLIIKTKKQLEFIDNCINELSDEHKDIVNLYFKEKKSVSFISLKLNISDATFYRLRDSMIHELSYLVFANAKINEDLSQILNNFENNVRKS